MTAAVVTLVVIVAAGIVVLTAGLVLRRRRTPAPAPVPASTGLPPDLTAREGGLVLLQISSAFCTHCRDTRTVLGMCLSAIDNQPVEGTRGYGVFRM